MVVLDRRLVDVGLSIGSCCDVDRLCLIKLMMVLSYSFRLVVNVLNIIMVIVSIFDRSTVYFNLSFSLFTCSDIVILMITIIAFYDAYNEGNTKLCLSVDIIRCYVGLFLKCWRLFG